MFYPAIKILYSENWGKHWKILAPLCFSIMMAILLDFLRTDTRHPPFDFIFELEMFFSILSLLFLGIYVRKCAQEAVQPSEDSYNSLLKSFLVILLADIGIIAICIFLASKFVYQAAYFFGAMFVGIFVSLWYFGTKLNSLGFSYKL